MKNTDRDDELERMRAKRRPSARVGRQAPPVGRREDFEDDYYDDDYCEEEQEYREDGFRDILIGDEPDEWDRPSSGRERIRSSSSGPGRSRDRSGTASGNGKKTAKSTASSRTSSDKSNGKGGAKAGQRTAGHDRRNHTERKKAVSEQEGQMGKKKKKHTWKSILLFLLVLLIGYGVWLFLHRPTGYWNIAVFGVDSRDGSTDRALADVQLICSIDRATGEIRLVSVYRDTYLKINSEGTYHKINEAYFKGGQKQAVDALEENLDLTIDDYATFNWKAVADAINILGGIDLELTQDEFKYINGFITETVESTDIASFHLKQAGMNHLDGVQAVAYCRLRLMDTDFQRTERQRKVVALILEKAKQADMSTLKSLAGHLIQEISTSVGIDDVLPMVKDIKKYHIGETAGFPFSRQPMRVGRMDCVIATTLESNVVLLHQFLYGEDVSYRPSSAVKKISARISEETGLYEEGKAAPTGGSSGGGASQDGQGGNTAPSGTAPPETAPAETIPTEESTEEPAEETVPEESEEDGSGSEAEAEETEGEIGPGVSDEPDHGPDQTEMQTEENGPGTEGPGAGSNPEEGPSLSPETSAPGDNSGGGNGGPDEGGPGV